MSVQVGNHNFSSIGRMFARQNVSAIYGRQKAPGGDEAEEASGLVDQVSLSPFAPQPLSGSLFADALKTAGTMNSGSKLSTEQVERLREDRVFSAVSALAALGETDAGNLPKAWPGGLPAPTGEEMEAARKRLSQRLRLEQNAPGQDALQQERVELLRRIRSRDFAVPPMEEAAAAAGPA